MRRLRWVALHVPCEQYGASAGHAVKETAGDSLAPVGNARRSEHRFRACDDVRLIEENATTSGMCRQNSSQHRALAATDIDNEPALGKIPGSHDGFGGAL